MFICPPPHLFSALSPNDPLHPVLSLLPAFSLPFFAFLNAQSLAGRGGGARGVGVVSCPGSDSAPCRRFSVRLHMTQFGATGNDSGTLSWPPAEVPGLCTLRMRGEGAGHGAGRKARGRGRDPPGPVAHSTLLRPQPTHLSSPIPLPPSSLLCPGSRIPPPAPPRRPPPPPNPLPRPSSSPRSPGPGPPVGPAAPIPATDRPLTPSWARRGPAR